MPLPGAESDADRSILKELVFNQYQAIVLGGAAALSLISLSPLPLLVWLGGELALLPLLDSRPLRRWFLRRRRAAQREDAEENRERVIDSLDAAKARRYAAMEHVCDLIEENYQELHGISQAYLTEQRDKLDLILDGCLHRLLALQRYEAMLARKAPSTVQQEIQALQRELAQQSLPERARVAVEKNLELKRRLLESLSEARGTMKAMATELDSMSSLLEVLHQNSISMRDPEAISQELDTIVRQSEDSERVVREMEAMLRAGGAEVSEPLVVPQSRRAAREASGRNPPSREASR
jgi:hypothetical protein